MRGRWAAGIVPRNFSWIIRDHLAISERPGGYAPNHRRVRRQEEILWLRGQGFTRVVSLLSSTHNLYAYDELGVRWAHFPVPSEAEMRTVVSELYPSLVEWLRDGERILVHQDELSDRVMGVVAGYLRWSGLLPEGPRAITAVEQIVKRQMGTAGRAVVALVDLLPPPAAQPAPTAEASGKDEVSADQDAAAPAPAPASVSLPVPVPDATAAGPLSAPPGPSAGPANLQPQETSEESPAPA